MYLGIDVGSVSTNLAVIDKDKKVIDSLYIRTEGDPVSAVKRGLREIQARLPNQEAIRGVGTTGSARYLAGILVNASAVKNEIIAHAIGTLNFIPQVRTIIEIGGQDSKIIIIRDGIPVDFSMNTVCLTGDTRITTNPYFQKTIKELKTGEKVLTHRGEFKEVEKIFERDYEGEMLKIENSKLKTLEITPEHPILSLKRKDIKCYRTGGKIAICKPISERSCKKRCNRWRKFSFEPKFIQAKELEKGDFIATPLPSEIKNISSTNYIEVKENQALQKEMSSRLKKKINKFIFRPDLLRLLGYYLAEGNISYNRSRKDKKIKYPCGVAFTFNINEKDYVNDIARIISQNFNLTAKIIEKPTRKTKIAEVSNRSLAEFIKYLCGSGADKKIISAKLLNLDPKLQKEILKGFFRGDGQLRRRPKNASSLGKIGNRYCAVTVSKSLAHQLYWLLLRNRIKSTLRKSSNKTKGGKYTYFITIHGGEINKLEDEILVSPKKKTDKSFIYLNWFLEPIKKIERYSFKGNVYNLEVKDDNSYVANFLAVHNCAAGTGSFLDHQAARLEIPIEEFGEYALRAKTKVNIAGRCTVFAESDMVHKQQLGFSKEDIINGLCEAIVRNYLNNVGKGKEILPPVVFQGGVAANKGVVKALQKDLGIEVIVPKYYNVMGAIGAAILAMEETEQTGDKTNFDFDVADIDFRTKSFECSGCPNRCEVIEVLKGSAVVDRTGSRCGRWEVQDAKEDLIKV